MPTFQSLTLGEIRRSIGINLGVTTDGVVTTTGDTSSLIDNMNLVGGDDEFNGREVRVYDAAGNIVNGESSIVINFTERGNDATCSPAFSDALTAGDKYEMWKRPWRISDINNAINQAIDHITRKALQVRQTTNNFTSTSTYEYPWILGFAQGDDFTHVSKVEYLCGSGTRTTIGSFAELAVSSGASAGDTLETQSISVDLSLCNEIRLKILSTVAVGTGELQLILSDGATVVETLNIPATLAHIETWQVIPLDNPDLDDSITSVGIKMVTDKGAFTLTVSSITAEDAYKKVYKELPLEAWDIAKGDVPLLRFTQYGAALIGSDNQVRLTGYEIVQRLRDDSDISEVDPAWVVAFTTGRLLISHAKSASLDIDDRKSLSQYWLGEAARLEPSITTSLPGGTRSVN